MVQIANGAFCGDPSNLWDDTSVWTSTFVARAAVPLTSFIVHWYQDWVRETRKYFDEGKIRTLTARGELPMISWAPRDPNAASSDTTYNHAAILAGTHDAYIATWAAAAKEYGLPLLIRPMWEMNLGVYSWGIPTAGQSQTNTSYINAFRYLVDAFDAAGATNVKWVWCPYVSASDMSGFYPGDAYVDYVGLDGYNNQAAATWLTFSQVFGASYTNLTGTVAPSKPLLICEVSSMEAGGDKAAWIADMYDQIQSTYPLVRGVVFFDQDKTSAGEKDWRIETSTASRDAYRRAALAPQNRNELEHGARFIEWTNNTVTSSLSNTGTLPPSRASDGSDIMVAFLAKGQFYNYDEASAPSGWTKLGEITDGLTLGQGNARIEVWQRRADGTETASPTWTVTNGLATAGPHLCSIGLLRGAKKTGTPFVVLEDYGEQQGGGYAAGSALTLPPAYPPEAGQRIIYALLTRGSSAAGTVNNAGFVWPLRFTKQVENNHLNPGVNASTLGVAGTLTVDDEAVQTSTILTNAQDRFLTVVFAITPEPPSVEGRVDAVLVQKNLGGRAAFVQDAPSAPGEYGMTYW